MSKLSSTEVVNSVVIRCSCDWFAPVYLTLPVNSVTGSSWITGVARAYHKKRHRPQDSPPNGAQLCEDDGFDKIFEGLCAQIQDSQVMFMFVDRSSTANTDCL